MNDKHQPISTCCGPWWAWSLLVLFLLPHHQLYNIPLVLLALSGLYLLVSTPRSLLQLPGSRTLLLLFACFWIPMLFSLPDAANPRSIKTTLEFIRFPLAGLMILAAAQEASSRRKIWQGITALCLFWAVDGLVQAVAGFNLLGYPVQPGAQAGNYFITGMFYPHFTLGHVLAILFPVYLEGIRRFARPLRLWRVLLAIPVIIAILLTGRRAAWIMMMLSASGYALYIWSSIYRQQTRRFLSALLLFGLLFGAIGSALYQWDDNFANRLDRTIPDPANLQQSLTEVTSLRTWIWEVALRMYSDHWINGVGPRGFRYVYGQYADAGDPFAQSGQTHAHMTLLEIASETGSIGLAGYLLFLVLLWQRYLQRNQQDSSHFATPLLIAIVVCVFPFNTAKAIYSSFLATLLWWLVPLYVAAIHSQNPKGEQQA